MAKNDKCKKYKECACKKCECDDPTVNIQGKQVKWSGLGEAEQEAIRQTIKMVEKRERAHAKWEMLCNINMVLIFISMMLVIISTIVKLMNGE